MVMTVNQILSFIALTLIGIVTAQLTSAFGVITTTVMTPALERVFTEGGLLKVMVKPPVGRVVMCAVVAVSATIFCSTFSSACGLVAAVALLEVFLLEF